MVLKNVLFGTNSRGRTFAKEKAIEHSIIHSIITKLCTKVGLIKIQVLCEN